MNLGWFFGDPNIPLIGDDMSPFGLMCTVAVVAVVIVAVRMYSRRRRRKWSARVRLERIPRTAKRPNARRTPRRRSNG